MRHQIAISLLCLLAAAGCSRPQASTADLQPWIAVTGHYSLVAAPAAPQPPAPTPDSDKCDDCAGRGWTGDGVTRLTCSSCNGTGRKVKSVLIVPAAPAAATLDCKDGRCTTRVIVR